MYVIENTVEGKIIGQFKTDGELIDFVKKIVVENEDSETSSIISVSDAKKYIEDYCDNLIMETVWVHPEQKENEILLINAKENEDWENKLLRWVASIRRGNVAYTTGGKEIVPDMKPLFVILEK